MEVPSKARDSDNFTKFPGMMTFDVAGPGRMNYRREQPTPAVSTQVFIASIKLV